MRGAAAAVCRSRQSPTTGLGRGRYRTTDVFGFNDPGYWSRNSVQPLLTLECSCKLVGRGQTLPIGVVPWKRCTSITHSGEKASGSNELNACTLPGPARDYRPARVRTAGLAMLRPRVSDMIELAVPGSLAARSTDRGRRVRKSVALIRATMMQATVHARLRRA